MRAGELVAVAILFFINLINYMDRFTVAGVLKDVQHFYGLEDQGGGLLQTCFVVGYMLFAPIFGLLGDRYNRKYILAGGILFWSITTYVGSLVPASNPGYFFLLRALVGVGEASYSTIAPTLIADLFVNEMRTRMLALFFFAIPVGSGLGYVVGSQVAHAFGDWKWAMRITPGLGLASVVAVLFVLQEPERGQSEGTVHLEKSSIINDLRYLAKNRSFVLSTIGFTCVCYATGAMAWWSPKYMTSAYAVAGSQTTEETINLIFGAITCLAGILGVVMGSGGAQWYRRKNPRADPLLCAWGVLLSVPFAFFGIVVAHKSAPLSWFSIFLAITFLCVNWTLVADILLYVVTPNRRSFAQAIQILAAHLLGDATSPFIVGALSDAFKGSDSEVSKYTSLQYALYSTCLMLIFAGISFLYNAHFIVQDKNLCKLQTQGHRLSSDTSIHTLPPCDSFASVDDDSLQSFPPLASASFESDTRDLIPRHILS